MAFWRKADNRKKHQEQARQYIVEDEQLLHTYGLMIDFVALTDQRIIFVEKSWVSKRSEVVSIPYSKIEEIALLKDRRMAISNPVRISTRSNNHQLNLIKGNDAVGFYKQLSRQIMNASE
ncbi:PH domain-containing protein [Natribacillus halophilus]|uniref:PH domain-containing protein n=1 Tax=Natribacillus halophilus TaxID=549003 RepID=A0A1G8S6C6_9BACI|nr:PH domain-containing protein [Natribacillus halophilus]SDJ24741.1 PH domain-containing protein [Natribacillus halophilus]